jgi:acyl-CoA thioesterase-1
VTFSRRQLIIAASLVLCAVLVFAWWNRGWSYANLPPTATGPWVAFGDSLTEGFGAAAGGDYPSQLSARIGAPIQNLGVSGETSSQGLARLPRVESLNPRVVLLCFGGNDVLQNVPRASMISNVGAMVDRLQAGGSFVVLIGVRGASLVGDRNSSAFHDLAREKKVLFVPDILDEIFNNPAFMSDYVHPNEAGYGLIAERVEKALAPVLSQLR